jgi:hypothetical protein
MYDGTRHPLHDAFRRRTLPDQIDYSRDATHDLVRLINGPHDHFAWEYKKFSEHPAADMADGTAEKSFGIDDKPRS